VLSNELKFIVSFYVVCRWIKQFISTMFKCFNFFSLSLNFSLPSSLNGLIEHILFWSFGDSLSPIRKFIDTPFLLRCRQYWFSLLLQFILIPQHYCRGGQNPPDPTNLNRPDPGGFCACFRGFGLKFLKPIRIGSAPRVQFLKRAGTRPQH
jgi:hypothetical protein